MSKKIFIHVDMNAFFASIEQRDFPELLGMPVAVTNGNHGSCIITSSYEARYKDHLDHIYTLTHQLISWIFYKLLLLIFKYIL